MGMSGIMSGMKGMFGPVGPDMCRLTMEGGIAVKTPSGYKSYNPATNSFVNCDSFVFDIGDEMFFVIPTNSVQTGDIILAGDGPRYVLKAEDNMLTTINYKTGTVENMLPERHVFMGNTYFYGKIVSMFGNLTGGTGTENVMKYMMMSQMMKSMGGKDSMNPMLMMMFMGGTNPFADMFSGIGVNASSVKGKRAGTGVLDEACEIKEGV